MEVQGRKGCIEVSTPKPVGTTALRNFVIPRKKRLSGQVHLEPCPEDSRDYTLIQTKLGESRLDMRKEHANTWLWKDVKLVHNDGFLKEFSEKRSEMRAKGRHGREIEEHYCFLVATCEATNQIYQFGLKTGSQDQYSLGKPSHGVYLLKHVDVALKHATASSCSGKNLIVFKVLFGKVKKVTPSLEWNRTVDPVISFDCHMAKDAVSYRDSVSQQLVGSSVFLFDYNQNQELYKRPRQCLPYAVVSFAPAGSDAAPLSISPPVSPTIPSTELMHEPSVDDTHLDSNEAITFSGPRENLKGCTVAKRTGKGENATVTFKRFVTKGCQNVEYQPQISRAEPFRADATEFQYNNLQTSPFNPHQAYTPYYDTAEYLNQSLLHYDSGISWQSYMGQSAFPSNIHNLSTTDVYGGLTDAMEVHQTSAEKISTVVYSSRLVKDPRLARQETNKQMKSSEEERASCLPECKRAQACQTHSQDQKEEDESTLSCEKQSLELNKEFKENRFCEPSLVDASKTNSTAQSKTENMPSIKLFKMKFQKYAPYFKLTEEERHRNIWSKGNLNPEQKQLLIERINFYELQHQRYKQGLLFTKDTETAFSLSHTDSKNNEVCSTADSSLLDKGEECDVNQSQCVNVSNLTPTTVLKDSGRKKVDILNADNDKWKQRVCRPKETHVHEEERDKSPDYEKEPQGGGMVQSIKDKERISETFIVQANVQSNPSEENKTLESALDFTESLCPSTQVSSRGVYENETSTSLKENFADKPTLSNTIEDCSESDHHIYMEVANCIDIPSTVLECNFCSNATAMGPGQHCQSCTETQDSETLILTNSEMSIEVEREEAQQQNTIYNSLYERLQLDQLLSNSNGADNLASKSYLRPKCQDKTPAIKLPGSQIDEPNEDDLQFIVKIKSSQTSPQRLTLSERFSNFRGLAQNLAAFVRSNKLTNSYAAHLNGDLNGNPDALNCCIDGGKGTGNNNAELIRFMAQKYNENRLKANCKRLRQKRSKILCRKSLRVLSKSKFRVQTQSKHIRKDRLLKAKRKCTNLALKSSSCVQATFSKMASDLSGSGSGTASHVDKGCDSRLNSPATSQALSGSQIHGKPLNNASSQNNRATDISEEGSCVNGENQTRYVDELFEIKGQYINPKQSTEIVCHNVSNISNQASSDSEDLVIIEEVERESNTKNFTSHDEKSSLVTCSGSNESSESSETEHEEGALLTRKLSQSDSCDTKEISPDNAGAYEDTSVPGDTSSGNMISSSAATVQTALTPDSPKVINNEANTQTKAWKLIVVNAVDSSGNGLTQRVLNTNKTGETNKICSRKDRKLYHKEKYKKSVTVQNRSKDDVAVIFTEKLNLSELASGSQYQPSSQDTTNSGITNPLVEMTSDSHSRIIKDTQKYITGTNEILHSAWGGQANNNLSTTSDTQIICKLRDYLTKFEFTVKKQDPVNNQITEDQPPMAWITLDSTAHKPILPKTSHYSKQGLADVTHNSTAHKPILPKTSHYSKQGLADVTHNSTAHKPILPKTSHYSKQGLADVTHNSTPHKPILPKTSHYSKQGLVDVTHKQGETVLFHVAPNKDKQINGDSQPKSPVPKKRRGSILERVSPDSTFNETVQNKPNSSLVIKDTQPYQTASSVSNTNHRQENHGNKLQENQIICSQVLGNINWSSGQHGNESSEEPCQINRSNAQTPYEQVHTTSTQNRYSVTDGYSVTDISSTLKLADHAGSVTELGPLRSKCKRMLHHFISNFEKDQKVSFQQSCITRNTIMEKYLRYSPSPVELKFDAINSFLELQMIIEACQFVDNKINFLRGKPTFRSLLWYDPSLYGELYKGAVGFQQQSSFFSSFQQYLTSNDYRRLQEYYCAVSTLHQQLQDAPDTSYYMYLKTKRERLELEAAFRNPTDVKNFFLSVPTAIMINLGDQLEILKKTYEIVMTFIETPADQLPGTFDVGKAEHLSIICRYLHEKILYLKTHKEMTKISWFGMEHLLYDASKILVWSESKHGMPNEVLRKYKRLSSQIVYGMTEDCVALVNKIDQFPQHLGSVKIRPPLQTNAIQIPPTAIHPEETLPAPNIQNEDGNKETHQLQGRSAMQPLFTDGVSSFIQPSLADQPGSSALYDNFTQGNNAVHWTIHENSAWDWSSPDAIQSTSHSEINALLLPDRIPTARTKAGTTSVTELQNSHAVRQQQISKPLVVKPRPVDRSKAPPTISIPQSLELLNEQANKFSRAMMPPLLFPCFSPDAPSVMPPPLPPLPFSSTSNQMVLHNNPTQINYPYFVFNGQTYSTTGSSVPVSAIHTETQYLPRPV